MACCYCLQIDCSQTAEDMTASRATSEAVQAPLKWVVGQGNPVSAVELQACYPEVAEAQTPECVSLAVKQKPGAFLALPWLGLSSLLLWGQERMLHSDPMLVAVGTAMKAGLAKMWEGQQQVDQALD